MSSAILKLAVQTGGQNGTKAYIQEILAVVGQGCKVFDRPHALLNEDIAALSQGQQAVHRMSVAYNTK